MVAHARARPAPSTNRPRTRRHGAMDPLDPGLVVAERRQQLAVAERPIRAAEAGVRGADDDADDHEQEGQRDGRSPQPSGTGSRNLPNRHRPRKTVRGGVGGAHPLEAGSRRVNAPNSTRGYASTMFPLPRRPSRSRPAPGRRARCDPRGLRRLDEQPCSLAGGLVGREPRQQRRSQPRSHGRSQRRGLRGGPRPGRPPGLAGRVGRPERLPHAHQQPAGLRQEPLPVRLHRSRRQQARGRTRPDRQRRLLQPRARREHAGPDRRGPLPVAARGRAPGSTSRTWNTAEAGEWGAEFVTAAPGGAPETIRARFEVQADGLTPGIGDPAPSAKTLTLDDVGGDVAKISSDTEPDPDLYRVSIDQALAEHTPFVVAFATPAFCKSRTCGPMLDVVKDVAADEPGVAFINVEPYQLAYTDGRLQPVLDANGQLQLVEASSALGPAERAVGLRRRRRRDRPGLVRGNRQPRGPEGRRRRGEVAGARPEPRPVTLARDTSARGGAVHLGDALGPPRGRCRPPTGPGRPCVRGHPAVGRLTRPRCRSHRAIARTTERSPTPRPRSGTPRAPRSPRGRTPAPATPPPGARSGGRAGTRRRSRARRS